MKELIKEINVLTIDKDSILVIYVDISKIHPSDADNHINKTIEKIELPLKKRNIEFFLIPQRDGKNAITFGSIKGEVANIANIRTNALDEGFKRNLDNIKLNIDGEAIRKGFY